MTNLLGPALAGVLIARARRGERDVARRGVVSRLGRADRRCSCASGASVHERRRRTRAASAPGCATCARDPLLARVSLSSLTVRLRSSRCSSRRFPCSPTSSTTATRASPGCCFAVIGGGQVVGSLLDVQARHARPAAAPRVVRRARDRGRRSGCSSRTCRSRSSRSRSRSCGASIPLINAPYIGMLTIRVPPALRGQGAAVADHDQPGARAARLRRSPGRCSSRIGLHDDVRGVAVLATFASAELHPRRRTGRGGPLPKKRLDVLLVERGLAESRAQAQALVMAGRVPGHSKPGEQVDETTSSSRSRRRRRTSRAPGTSSRTRSTRSARRRPASTASTSAPRPAGSPTCSCSAARRA